MRPSRAGTAPGPRSFPLVRSRGLPSAQSPLVALLALVGTGLLATGAAAGRPALAAAVLVIQLLLGLCWLTVLQASLTTAALVGLAALACDSLLLRSDRADAGSMAGVLGLALVTAIVAQLLRRRRRDVTAGLVAALSGVVLMAAAALPLALRPFEDGPDIALVALVAIAVALVAARLLPGPALPVRAGALLLAVVVGGRYGIVNGAVDGGPAAALSAAAAAFALVVDLGVVRMSTDVGRGQLAALRPVAGFLPVVAALPAVYVGAWILSG